MLYRYNYIKKHPLHRLHKHLLFFFRRIRTISSNASFKINGDYFHSDFSDILRISPNLKEKFKTFFNSYKQLTDIQKNEFYNLVVKCQSVKYFFGNKSINCLDIKKDSIQQLMGNNSLYELMKYLYETTIKADRWEMKDHYQKMYNGMPQNKVCPFCGVESMHQTFKEDYDHLLTKSIYPLLAINLQNLVPMCSVCNEKAKKEIDILYKNNGERRSFAYPYATEITISLDFTGSIIPQTDMNNEKGIWKLTINPQNENNMTWFEVFNIEERYTKDYLLFDLWTDIFIDDLINSNKNPINENSLKTELLKVAQSYERRKFNNRNIIKAPLFSFLANCNNKIFYKGLIRAYNKRINT
ncbi:hypothetical protein EZS27_001769 [termite gut metagenome]|uniref:HNH nuclease domain-containing protein n=1 Tax=termite gut metagenome TaxID=433724 RepID=A0A5J4SYW1_9ZZZZ